MIFFFFFSSRRRHTRFSRDWSSDVCSSDLPPARSLPTPFPSNLCMAGGRAMGCGGTVRARCASKGRARGASRLRAARVRLEAEQLRDALLVRGRELVLVELLGAHPAVGDRKSTRLNSS